jgi:hypothetical protein
MQHVLFGLVVLCSLCQGSIELRVVRHSITRARIDIHLSGPTDQLVTPYVIDVETKKGKQLMYSIHTARSIWVDTTDAHDVVVSLRLEEPNGEFRPGVCRVETSVEERVHVAKEEQEEVHPMPLPWYYTTVTGFLVCIGLLGLLVLVGPGIAARILPQKPRILTHYDWGRQQEVTVLDEKKQNDKQLAKELGLYRTT